MSGVRRGVPWGALLAALQAPALAHAACGDGYPMRASQGAQAVALRSVPAAIPLDRHFVLELQLCPVPKGVTSLRVDADMPAHRHGMNYKTRLVAANAAAGRYRAEGLLFHMPGRWRFIVDLVTPEGPLRLTHELEVQ